MPRATATTADVEIPVGEFIESDAHAIPVAGLLASDPGLRDTRLTRAEWTARLAKYLATPTS